MWVPTPSRRPSTVRMASSIGVPATSVTPAASRWPSVYTRSALTSGFTRCPPKTAGTRQPARWRSCKASSRATVSATSASASGRDPVTRWRRRGTPRLHDAWRCRHRGRIAAVAVELADERVGFVLRRHALGHDRVGDARHRQREHELDLALETARLGRRHADRHEPRVLQQRRQLTPPVGVPAAPPQRLAVQRDEAVVGRARRRAEAAGEVGVLDDDDASRTERCDHRRDDDLGRADVGEEETSERDVERTRFEVGGITGAELDVLEPGLGGGGAGPVDHDGIHVDPDDGAGSADTSPRARGWRGRRRSRRRGTAHPRARRRGRAVPACPGRGPGPGRRGGRPRRLHPRWCSEPS